MPEKCREKRMHGNDLVIILSSESLFPAPQNTDVFFFCILVHIPHYNHCLAFRAAPPHTHTLVPRIADQGSCRDISLIATASASNGIDITSHFSAEQLFRPGHICSQFLPGYKVPIHQCICPLCFPVALPILIQQPCWVPAAAVHGEDGSASREISSWEPL